MKIDPKLFIYDYKKYDINSIRVECQNLSFNFACNGNINDVNYTMQNINKKDHIYDFKFTRIFVMYHVLRAKAIYNKLYEKIHNSNVNNYLDQFLEKYKYFEDWFFLEERMIKIDNNNNKYTSDKERIFFCFIKPEITLYPLYVDSEHVTCPPKNNSNNKK